MQLVSDSGVFIIFVFMPPTYKVFFYFLFVLFCVVVVVCFLCFVFCCCCFVVVVLLLLFFCLLFQILCYHRCQAKLQHKMSQDKEIAIQANAAEHRIAEIEREEKATKAEMDCKLVC